MNRNKNISIMMTMTSKEKFQLLKVIYFGTLNEILLQQQYIGNKN